MSIDPYSLTAFSVLKKGSFETTCGSQINCWFTPPEQHQDGMPVLVMIHGWPQTSFMWRHVIRELEEKKYPLFIADLPGYGLSSPSTTAHDRLTIGTSILEAFSQALPSSKDIIFFCHDRGARTAPRLCVSCSNFPNLTIHAAILFDIVPYVEQFAAFANPSAATAFYHWSLLPVQELALPMIMAYGGDKFALAFINKACGQDGRIKARLDGAWEHYAESFKSESVNLAASEDYKAGATVDYQAQIDDQKNGRKIDVPTLVIYGEQSLGMMHDVPERWKDWVNEGTKLECVGIKESGHYVPEEAPEKTLEIALAFLKSIGF